MRQLPHAGALRVHTVQLREVTREEVVAVRGVGQMQGTLTPAVGDTGLSGLDLGLGPWG